MSRTVVIEYDGSRRHDGPVRLPLSKSIAARALVLSHVHQEGVCVGRLPDCDDTRELAGAFRQLKECGGRYGRYDLGTGGTSLRFFLAYAASCPGFAGEIDCSDALRRRPLAPLIEALRSAGADIECLEKEGYAPLRVNGRRLTSLKAGDVEGSVSSQFVSALMMASEMWEHPFGPCLEGMVSRPYVEMTGAMLRRMRRLAEEEGTSEIYEIEGDWSAASYFYELALLAPGRAIRLSPLTDTEDSLQGDSRCAELFVRLGVRTWQEEKGNVRICCDGAVAAALQEGGRLFEADMNSTPDLVPALAAGLCMSGIPFRLTGIGHLRHKESDRLSALCEELAKTGCLLRAGSDSLCWNGEKAGESVKTGGICFDAHADHRIAMAMAVCAVKLGKIEIAGAECVSKSFPGFFEQLQRTGFSVGVRQD